VIKKRNNPLVAYVYRVIFPATMLLVYGLPEIKGELNMEYQ